MLKIEIMRWLLFFWIHEYKSIEALSTRDHIVCFGYCSDESDSLIERGLVDGGWDKLLNIKLDPRFQIDHCIKVIQDCDGY